MQIAPAVRGSLMCVAVAALAVFAPNHAQSQSGKWVATIPSLSNGGAADLTVDSRNDKQSRAKISLRNGKSNVQLAWDIVKGSCRDDGAPVAAQAAFNPVQTQMDGGGTATANIPKLESGQRYYVRVFNPQTLPTDGAAYGCANISEKP